MSDFGSILFIKKTNGAVSESDLNSISNQIKSICEDEDLADALGEAFNTECELDDNDGLCRLSEHYFGENPDEEREFIEDSEGDQTNVLARKLKEAFGDFEFSTEIISW